MDLWSPAAIDERLYPLLDTERGSAISVGVLRFMALAEMVELRTTHG